MGACGRAFERIDVYQRATFCEFGKPRRDRFRLAAAFAVFEYDRIVLKRLRSFGDIEGNAKALLGEAPLAAKPLDCGEAYPGTANIFVAVSDGLLPHRKCLTLEQLRAGEIAGLGFHTREKVERSGRRTGRGGADKILFGSGEVAIDKMQRGASEKELRFFLRTGRGAGTLQPAAGACVVPLVVVHFRDGQMPRETVWRICMGKGTEKRRE